MSNFLCPCESSNIRYTDLKREMNKNGHRYLRIIRKFTIKYFKTESFSGEKIIVGHLTFKVLRSAAFYDKKDNCKPKKALRPMK